MIFPCVKDNHGKKDIESYIDEKSEKIHAGLMTGHTLLDTITLYSYNSSCNISRCCTDPIICYGEIPDLL